LPRSRRYSITAGRSEEVGPPEHPDRHRDTLGLLILGQILLEALGTGLPSFSIAGGVVLLVISLRAIFEGVHDEVAEEEKKAASGFRDLAVFPLATPLVAGPGSILVVALLTDNNRFSWPEQTVTVSMLLVVLLFTYLVLRAAESVQRVLSVTGISVVSRVSGLILAALSVETILDRIRETFSLAS
jgi:multiple antibiotic resistance protein